MRQDEAATGRWSARPGRARALRAAVFLTPVAASALAAWLVHRELPPAAGPSERAGHLALLLVVSTVTLVATDRLARRLLPLATLLELTMLFPDRAPSRSSMARDAARRRPVEVQLERVREAGADPGAVAREVLSLVASLSAHDRPTRGHAERVRMLTDLVAEAMHVPARDRDLLRWAAILHDIGKLRIPPSLLNKPGRPTADEWALLRAHPAHGAEIAGALVPWLGEWGEVIVSHHERWDGSGYPQGLAGHEVGLGGRIVAVVDAFDVMTAARAYRRPVSRAAACRELVRFSGSQFDPTVVRAMVSLSAPRLRRAQGLLSWLADVPIVASGAVPAATVARVVGAGALATGSVTLGPALPTEPPHAPPVVAATQEAGAGGPDAPVGLTVAPGDPRPAARVRPRVEPPGGGPAAADATGASGSRPSGPSGGSGSTGTSPDGPPRPGDTVDDAVSEVIGPVEDVAGGLTTTVDDLTGAVTGTVGAATGTSATTGAVNGVVDNMTDTVDETVGGATGAVDGLVGGLLRR